MINSKGINVIVAIAVTFALVLSTALVVAGNMQKASGSLKSEPEYATKVFGTDIISIDIIADEEDWQEMLDNARSEQFIMVDVVINGTKFKNVGIRPKGNSSLTQVANSDSDRYSFRLQFDEYIKGQTCFGLESMVLNNMLGDNTYMKEYVSYDLMREVGVDAPYFGYADIKVNGENQGLYLAVELYNDSYEQRVFGDISGMLYNVKSMDMGNWDGNAPGAPGGGMPGMFEGGMPRMPEGGMPGMFEGGMPGMPEGGMPGMSEGDKPGMPEGGMPGMSEGGKPGMPEGNMPGMPDGQRGTSQRPNNAPQRGFGTQRNPGVQPIPSDGKNESGFNPPSNTDENPFVPQMGGGMGGMRGNFGGRGWPGGRGGGSLEYTDDNIESYSSIFNNVVGKGKESDYRRVIKALKALSEGKELEKYFDVDKILRYLAAHTFVVNLDSYSSSMAQNYYIYERNGKLTVLPWDYNLAWGGFQNGDASSVVNFPIDTPVSGVEMSSRPLIEKLFSNTEYLERYHNYLQQLIDNYFANGKFEKKIESLDALISQYVKNDTTAFCTFEEYKNAVSAFITLGNLRAQSVQGQLDGTVPSTTEGQKANPEKLISPGDLKLSVLGSMMGGRGGRDNPFAGGFESMDMELMRKAGEIIMQANGQITDEVKEKLKSIGLTDEQINWISSITGGRFGWMGQNRGDRSSSDNKQGMEALEPNRRFSGNPFTGGFSDRRTENNNIALMGILSFVLVAAIIFAARFRKTY